MTCPHTRTSVEPLDGLYWRVCANCRQRLRCLGPTKERTRSRAEQTQTEAEAVETDAVDRAAREAMGEDE